MNVSPLLLKEQAEHMERWNAILRTDPRRAVRVLNVPGPTDETIDGDTAIDIHYVLENLKVISKDGKAEVWKKAVSAGVAVALAQGGVCFAAKLNPEAAGKDANFEALARQMIASNLTPLEILYNALTTGASPPGATEKQVVGEVKEWWPSIMRRTWAEPGYSLEQEPKNVRSRERMIVSYLLVKLIELDPSFLDLILKPDDFTLAVIFRYWMAGTAMPDTRANQAVFLNLLDTEMPLPANWEKHFSKYPPPPLNSRLVSMLRGASKNAASDKKRTPKQAANAIVSAFATHLNVLPPGTVLPEYSLFHALFTHTHALQENWAFGRAVYTSSSFWEANAGVMKRAAVDPSPVAEPMFLSALMTYASVMAHADEHKEGIDDLVYSIVSTGLFDALEQGRDALVKLQPEVFREIIGKIDTNIANLSARTRQAIHAELPRPRLTRAFMERAMNLTGPSARLLQSSSQLLLKLEVSVGILDERREDANSRRE